ncbi:MAG: undecaprenyl-diphosphate phosphatase [Candidatus Eisenbacteria bacterium]|nr:undecaprenyl-diphosphate phosphatase [Candidatus Eisenbacteria bacterium]
MNWWTALILGIVQGFTELLPVSSSGHLVLFERLLGVRLTDASFEITVHVATAAALCLVLRREIWLMLRSILPAGTSQVVDSKTGGFLPGGSVGSQVEGSQNERRRGRLLILAVVIGTLPAVLVGAVASDKIEAAFHGATLTVAMLPLTGVFLILTRWAQDRGRDVSKLRALIVGVAQAIAILPGISRSGMTVGTGLFLGVTKEQAVKFSFLLSIPAIAGGALLKLAKGSSGVPSVGAQNLAIASVVAFLSALLAARVLFGVVRRGKLDYFGYYCLAVGVLGLLFLAR